VLHTPLGCKLDPTADRHALLMEGTTEPPPDDLYEPIRLADLPASRRTNVTSLGTRTGSAGENFVLTQDVSNATLTLGGPGSLGQEIVFRGDTDSSAATGLRTLTNCRIDIVGNFCGLARLVLRNCYVYVNNRSCFVTRCEFTDFSSTQLNDTPLDVDALAKSALFSCHKCDFTDRLGANTGGIIYKTVGLEMTFAYNLVEKHMDSAAAGERAILIYYGESENTTNIKSLLKVHHNLFLDCNVADLIEIKASYMDWYENTAERCRSAGVRIRHGIGHKVRRNLYIDPTGSGQIKVRTGPHQITENHSRTASGAPGPGSIWLYAGKLHWDYEIWKDQRVPGQGDNWQAAGQCTVVGNDFQVIVGVKSCKENPECYDYKATDNNVGPTSGPSRNRSITLQYEQGTKRLAVPGYDIDTVLPRMQRGNVGLRAP
jgi:hypothetical protein